MITEKRKEQEIISVLAPDHRKRIGKSKSRDRSRNHELIFVSKKKKKQKSLFLDRSQRASKRTPKGWPTPLVISMPTFVWKRF